MLYKKWRLVFPFCFNIEFLRKEILGMQELTDIQKKVLEFRLIDDAYFEVFADDVPTCQEMLRIILSGPLLIVKDVIVQRSERNLYGRSVRLDALCILGNGSHVNIEIQRADNDNHLKRARYNASMITSKILEPGERYENVTDVYIVYISEHDFLEGKKTIYHVDKVLRETGTVIDDGLHEIFVNIFINDGTDIAEMMSCFMKKDFENSKFPNMTARNRYLKDPKGGMQEMCTIMEEVKAEGRAELAETIKALKNGVTKEELLKMGINPETITLAEELIS